MTRSVVLDEFMSSTATPTTGGRASGSATPTSASPSSWGDVIASQDTVLLGRVTFEKRATHWPTSDMQPFADFINTTTQLGVLVRAGDV